MVYTRRSSSHSKRGYSWTWWVIFIAGVFFLVFMVAISLRMMYIASLHQALDSPQHTRIRSMREATTEEQIAAQPLPAAETLLPKAAVAPQENQQSLPSPGGLPENMPVLHSSASLSDKVASAEVAAPMSVAGVQTVIEDRILELSQGLVAAGDVHGNLGPPSVVTAAKVPRDWLKDRWQAAKDMTGAPIPGEHWLSVDLLSSGLLLSWVVIDFETAHASAYSIETAGSAAGPWRRLAEVRSCCSKGLKVEKRDRHVLHTISPETSDWKADRIVRARFTELATMWGVSVWRFRIFGRKPA
eukprot:TRINITY_DN108199_c0_g1_i1.p1 TRINITY_DN108199_c0_g1~~TRINITY_DN108199_c0_g1_i1.p1  ORF type:complete len:300 (+),score=67.56 TRINITY_DN108199_c0_g1_i1:21-920(+)